MARRPRRLLLVVSVLATVLVQARPPSALGMVPSTYWDYAAIKYVFVTKGWMHDYGDSYFKPDTLETKAFLARTLIQMYAPSYRAPKQLSFSDLPQTSPLYPYANDAVQLGWLSARDGRFYPDGVVRLRAFDKALTLAMGLSAPAAGLAAIHTAAGTRYPVPWSFPFLQLGRTLELHPSRSNPAQDLEAADPMPRDEVAYSLWMASYVDPVQQPWVIQETSLFDDITLATPSSTARQQVTQFALSTVGYPYIWGGEWYRQSPPGYCCGYQPKGGFDCSGLAWWVLKLQGEQGYSNAGARPYAGWSLPQRTSEYMAKATATKVWYSNLRVGDLMLFATSGSKVWQNVDHVGIWLGNGWMIDSRGSADGPSLDYVGSGTWWRQRFAWGRRLIG